MDKETRERYYKHICLPQNYWNCTLSEIPDDVSSKNKQGKPYKEVIKNWIVDFKDNRGACKGFYLYGDYGVGKSGLAAILLMAATHHGVFGLWCDFQMIHKYSIKDEKYMFSEHSTMMDRILEADILVIDEVTLDRSVDWSLKQLENIVRLRWQNCKRTIITTNCTPNNFASDPRTKGLSSILSESAYSLMIHGKNFRKK